MARGDQIYTERTWAGVAEAYSHHGIDCGDGTVIHYSKQGETPTVRRTSLAAFAPSGRVFVQVPTTSYIPEQVVRRAEGRLGEQKYNLLFNNCEHFATWCKTGRSYSRQIAESLPLLTTIDPTKLDQELHTALAAADHDPQVLFDRALADIRRSWDQVQPQYNAKVAERREWDQVAREALRRGREDLARAAIGRKLSAQQAAVQYQGQLDHLAALTETLIRNRQNLA